jgi:hypothetical protein
MAVEDLIADATREEVRDLRTQFLNYEVQKQAVHLAYAQVDGARREKVAPPRPGGGDPTSGGNAALTNQLLNAIRGKLTAQDQMYAIWINYQLTRLQLYRDMEMMDLNQRGVWIDEHATDDAVAVPGHHGSSGPQWGPAPERLPEPLPLPDLLPVAGPGPKAQLGPPQ